MSEARQSIINEVLSYHQEMVRFAAYLCKDSHAAEDLAQEALIRIYNYKKIEKITNVKAWVFRIIRNIHIDKIRVRPRRPYTQTIENGSSGGTNESVASYTPNREIEAFERHGSGPNNYDMMFSDEVVQAINEVPENYIKAVILSDVEDHTYDEIASKLSIPVGTVRSRIFRGRKLLRERIANRQAV